MVRASHILTHTRARLCFLLHINHCRRKASVSRESGKKKSVTFRNQPSSKGTYYSHFIWWCNITKLLFICLILQKATYHFTVMEVFFCCRWYSYSYSSLFLLPSLLRGTFVIIEKNERMLRGGFTADSIGNFFDLWNIRINWIRSLLLSDVLGCTSRRDVSVCCVFSTIAIGYLCFSVD